MLASIPVPHRSRISLNVRMTETRDAGSVPKNRAAHLAFSLSLEYSYRLRPATILAKDACTPKACGIASTMSFNGAVCSKMVPRDSTRWHFSHPTSRHQIAEPTERKTSRAAFDTQMEFASHNTP